jgi:type I restriction enzyme S subunit
MALAGQGKTKATVAQLGFRAACNQSLAAIVPDSKFNPGFLYWWLKNQYDPIRNLAGGDLRDGLNLTVLGDLTICCPPLEEQPAIAGFLDRETSKIDALVAEQERLIALLKEKRKAVISQAVTKGLDLSVPMKDSGVEWLGEVPSGWTVARIKDAGRLQGGAGFPHDQQGISGEELPFYKVANLGMSEDGFHIGESEHSVSYAVALQLGAKVIPTGSVLYAKIGAALLLNRRRVSPSPCCIDNNMTAFIPADTKALTKWSWYWLSVLDFGRLANPGAVPSFSEGDQSIAPMLLPPISEQRAIVGYLDAQLSKLDALSSEAEQAIALLRERRAAVISAAVTGKIDVRDFAASPEAQAA